MPSPADPVAISMFGLEIRWYAIFVLAGVFCSLAVLRWLASQRALDPEFVLDAAPWVVFLALIGARLYYVLLKFGYYRDHPGEAINLRLGGLTVHGAIAGGVLGLYLVCRNRNQRFLTWGDLTVAALPVGQAIGRWGNWANQEAFGRPSDLPWALEILPENRPAAYIDSATFHPAFLYESLLDLVIAAVLIWLVLNMPQHRFWREGDAIWVYFLLYGSVRFAIESMRTDSLYIGPWPAAYWVSWALILAGAILLIARRTIWPGERVADLHGNEEREPASAELTAMGSQ